MHLLIEKPLRVLATILLLQGKGDHGGQADTGAYHFQHRDLHGVQLFWSIKNHHVVSESCGRRGSTVVVSQRGVAFPT